MVPTSSHDKKRLLFLFIFIFCLFSLLIMRFYSIQILEGEKWTKKANNQHYLVVKEPFKRGSFYSTTACKKNCPLEVVPLAIDLPKYQLCVDPGSIPPPKKNLIATAVVSQLRKMNVKLSSDENQQVTAQFFKKSRHRRLSVLLDKKEKIEFECWWKKHAKSELLEEKSLYFLEEHIRSYPFQHLLGQILHTIQIGKDEKTDQGIPTGGLELHFNSYLKGKSGKKRFLRSPRNSLETGEVISHPENGMDIYLTINHYIQAIAEEELERGVKKSKAKCGWAVVMDPNNGEVLALAQYPFFYPPNYQYFFNNPQLIEHTKIKAITDANEPGSVFKPFIAALALKANDELVKKGEKKLFSPEEMIATSNGAFPGRSKPITDTSMHHFLNMDMAIQKSSNIYMGRLMERMIQRFGNEWIRKELIQTFGFGQKTGIELPAESPGVLPTPGKLHPNGTLEWSIATPFSIAIGHNIQATTLQIARAFSVLSNGKLIQPTIIKKIARGDQEVILPEKPKPKTVLSPAILKRLWQSLLFVTQPRGTAHKAKIPGYTVVGKTSTPKKIVNGAYSERLYCPLFAGFAPFKNPRVVIVITIDEPEYSFIPGYGKNHNGGNCTAQVFREIAKRTLSYLGEPIDDPFGYPIGDPRANPDKRFWGPESKKLQLLYEQFNH